MSANQQSGSAYQALRIVLGSSMVVSGLDKFFNLLTDWEQYVSPVARRKLSLRTRDFMRLVGVVEMAVGGTILSGRTRVGGYAAGLWLLAIAANLISSGEYFDIAARDANLAAAAYALARLSSARAKASRVGVWDEIQKAA